MKYFIIILAAFTFPLTLVTLSYFLGDNNISWEHEKAELTIRHEPNISIDFSETLEPEIETYKIYEDEEWLGTIEMEVADKKAGDDENKSEFFDTSLGLADSEVLYLESFLEEPTYYTEHFPNVILFKEDIQYLRFSEPYGNLTNISRNPDLEVESLGKVLKNTTLKTLDK